MKSYKMKNYPLNSQNNLSNSKLIPLLLYYRSFLRYLLAFKNLYVTGDHNYYVAFLGKLESHFSNLLDDEGLLTEIKKYLEDSFLLTEQSKISFHQLKVKFEQYCKTIENKRNDDDDDCSTDDLIELNLVDTVDKPKFNGKLCTDQPKSDSLVSTPSPTSVSANNEIIQIKNVGEANCASRRGRKAGLKKKPRKRKIIEESDDEDSLDITESEDESNSSKEVSLPAPLSRFSNRPRRACTMKVNYAAKHQQTVTVDSKGKQNSASNSKSNKPQTSKASSCFADNSARSVENLVVNCDPFNIATEYESRDGPRNNFICSSMDYIGNRKNIFPIKQPKSLSTLPFSKLTQLDDRNIIHEPISQIANNQVPVNSNASSVVNQQPSPTVNNTSLAKQITGKSLGKVLLINSVPFLIQNGDKFQLPMISKNLSNHAASELAKNLTSSLAKPSTAVGAVSGKSTSQPNKFENSSLSTNNISTSNSRSKSNETKKPTKNTAKVKVEIISSDSEDCKEKVQNEIRKIQQQNKDQVKDSSVSGPGQQGKVTKCDKDDKVCQPVCRQISINSNLYIVNANGQSTKQLTPGSKVLIATGPNLQNKLPLSTSQTGAISNGKMTPVTLSVTGDNTRGSSSSSFRYLSNKQLLLKKFKTLHKNWKTGVKLTNVSADNLGSSSAAKPTGSNSELFPLKTNDRSQSSSKPSTSSSQTSSSTAKSVVNLQTVTNSHQMCSDKKLPGNIKSNSFKQMVDPENPNIILYRDHKSGNVICYKCNCADCPGFISPRKDKVVWHIRCRHSCDKPFKCNSCSKSFALRNYLTLHQRVHESADRYFQCTVDGCMKTFKMKKSFRGHMLRHYYEKPFVCRADGCTERYIYSYQLKEHEQHCHQNFDEIHYKTEESPTSDF